MSQKTWLSGSGPRKLTNYFMVAFFLMLLACSSPEVKFYNEGIRIVPQPNDLVAGEGSFTLNPKTVFVVEDAAEVQSVIGFFNAKIKTATGFNLAVQAGEVSANYISVKIMPEREMGDEAYALTVSEAGVAIEAKTARGAFYGLQTMLQLLPAEIESPVMVSDVPWEMPAVTINDAPQFPYRGMHLDVCRHFIPVENIKKHLDMMALFKLNKFHWHLTEDQAWRIEIKKYPLLTEMGATRVEGEGFVHEGFYSQDEVRDIVAYAAERYIDVIPEIELPGHALAALVGYPQFSCAGGPFKVRIIWGVEEDVYCAGKEETFEFLEDVIDEVVELFPYEYFHIGGDECPKDQWKVCPDCQARIKAEGLKDEHELQSYFVQRIEKVLLAHDRKMIGWDEILEGGLAASATVMSWRGEAGGIEAAEMGHDVIMTPGGWCYLDHFQGSRKVEPVAIDGFTTLEKSYSYHPIPEVLSPENAKHILGTQGNVWTEYLYTPEKVEYAVYPRIIALAEVGWTHPELKDFESFLDRLNKQFVRMDMHDINYHIPLPEGVKNQEAFVDSISLTFTTTRPIKMVYTLDGSEPDAQSAVYDEPLKFTESGTLKIASLLETGRMSMVRTIEVNKEVLAEPAQVSDVQPGLKMRIADRLYQSIGELDKVQDWQELTVAGNATSINRHFSYKQPSAAILTGYLNIEDDGVYEFSTDIDHLYIGERLLINNEGEVRKYSREDASMALAKGKHPVKMIFLNNISGGWPQIWSGAVVRYKKSGDEKFSQFSEAVLSF
jgi:hexosaminidase